MNVHIKFLKQCIHNEKWLLHQMLQGEETFEMDKNDPLLAYKWTTHPVHNYLELAEELQLSYCASHARLAKCYSLLATEQAKFNLSKSSCFNFYRAFSHGANHKIMAALQAQPHSKKVDLKEHHYRFATGLKFLLGIGHQQHPKAAFLIFKKLANQNRHAKLMLGLMYEHGCGTRQNLQRAKLCYQSCNLSQAKYRLGCLYLDDRLGKPQRHKALNCFKHGIHYCQPQALEKISCMYKNGYGLFFSNQAKAKHYKDLARLQFDIIDGQQQHQGFSYLNNQRA